MNDRRKLTQDEVKELLKKLDLKLKRDGVTAKLLLVGGVAVSWNHERGTLSDDVDGLYSPANLKDYVLELAAEEGLASDWLNSKFTIFANAVPAALYTAYSRLSPTGPGLTVEAAPDEVLLAMKLVAERQKDLPDIAVLALDLGFDGSSTESLRKLLLRMWPGEYELADAMAVRGDEDPDEELEDLLARMQKLIQAEAARRKAAAAAKVKTNRVSGVCSVCSRPLTSPASIARGYGQACGKKR